MDGLFRLAAEDIAVDVRQTSAKDPCPAPLSPPFWSDRLGSLCRPHRDALEVLQGVIRGRTIDVTPRLYVELRPACFPPHPGQ